MEQRIHAYSSCAVNENGTDAQGFGLMVGAVALTLLPVDGHPWASMVDYTVYALTRLLAP